ncbi:hypothetical protein PF005_g15026 [Phytophthora fragariae]|uniref:Uncharacterized protein n=1 Tax=Phytophthora fragariae TaxID=53985 RepID=A0A6A3RPX8_9STRA|nr:hypothetical protein PF003_g38762 [Phytophthora fragariae]KAE8936489.1 hypothetical protein PF009_g13586 [Phytophthora fragariae]KAE9000666.1 hypothetical protein PF011_g14080 [Phytophthora fragariae]KAE9085404.1 hypothetical protein PF010_g20470 [Phytophthora fragariae]KAE9100649.1 hypothetical protein PF007_g15426 [Phytophthora fragariae]
MRQTHVGDTRWGHFGALCLSAPTAVQTVQSAQFGGSQAYRGCTACVLGSGDPFSHDS